MSLGDFGTPHEPLDEEFGYFGRTIRVNPDLTDLAIVDYSTRASAAGDDPAAAVGLLREMIAIVVHPDDVEAFWTLARQNRQSTEDISQVALSIIEQVTARPTERPSDSSHGRPSTAPSSTGGSTSLALGHLQGRPDLQLMVLQADEARQAG